MSNNNNKITIKTENLEAWVVAERGPEPYDNTLVIGMQDRAGCWYQDLAVIKIDKENPDKIEISVYADHKSEDHTHRFEIERVKIDEEKKEIK